MARLIDADELQKALARMWYDSPISITGISVSALIDEQPTIEAEPVRHGKWIDTGNGVQCSECGEAQFGYDSYRYYCPTCGAKMEYAND